MYNPRIGVATIVKKDNAILLGLRKSELGKNTWGLPGGKLYHLEDPKDCALRELKEETNLVTTKDKLVLAGTSNTIFDENTHYITIIYEVKSFSGKLKLMEPDKCQLWSWFEIPDIPDNIFLPLKNYLKENSL